MSKRKKVDLESPESIAYAILTNKATIKSLFEYQDYLYEKFDDTDVYIGEVFDVEGGGQVEYVDNFQDQNVVYRPAAVRRFELKEVKPKKEKKKKEKKGKEKPRKTLKIYDVCVPEIQSSEKPPETVTVKMYDADGHETQASLAV